MELSYARPRGAKKRMALPVATFRSLPPAIPAVSAIRWHRRCARGVELLFGGVVQGAIIRPGLRDGLSLDSRPRLSFVNSILTRLIFHASIVMGREADVELIRRCRRVNGPPRLCKLLVLEAALAYPPIP